MAMYTLDAGERASIWIANFHILLLTKKTNPYVMTNT